MTRRCHLVYAIAPDATSASDANDLLNEYIGDRRRGIIVYHDHFTGRPHGGVAVWDVQSDEQTALLDDVGPLEGWSLAVHPLVFSLTANGFAAQTHFTLAEYAGTTLEELAAGEGDDPRYWWRRRP